MRGLPLAARFKHEVWRAGSRPPARHERIGKDRQCVILFGQNGVRSVMMAELDVPVVDQRWHCVDAEMRRGATNVTGVGLLDGQRTDRPAFGLVSVEQLRA